MMKNFAVVLLSALALTSCEAPADTAPDTATTDLSPRMARVSDQVPMRTIYEGQTCQRVPGGELRGASYLCFDLPTDEGTFEVDIGILVDENYQEIGTTEVTVRANGFSASGIPMIRANAGTVAWLFEGDSRLNVLDENGLQNISAEGFEDGFSISRTGAVLPN